MSAGGTPFTYENKEKGKRIEMSYVTVPDGDIDDRKALLLWGKMAAATARGAKSRSTKPTAKVPSKSAST